MDHAKKIDCRSNGEVILEVRDRLQTDSTKGLTLTRLKNHTRPDGKHSLFHLQPNLKQGTAASCLQKTDERKTHAQ
jgi:hypothetical protein